eukprot:172623_1
MDELKKNKTAFAIAVAAAAVGAAAIYYLYSNNESDDQQNNIQRTFAFIKPDAFSSSEEIKKRIVKEGFRIKTSRRITLTQEQASLFYTEHTGKPFFDDLIKYMTSGPVWALMLERENAVRVWRDLMGPTDAKKAKEEAPNSIRAIWGTDITANAAHGSDSAVSAERELGFFFDD